MFFLSFLNLSMIEVDSILRLLSLTLELEHPTFAQLEPIILIWPTRNKNEARGGRPVLGQ